MSSSTHAIKVAISRVLVGIDFSESSEKALRHAIAISRSYGAKFYFAHVVSSLGFVMAGPEVTAMAAEATARDLQKLETYLLQTGALTGILYEAMVCQGEIWQELKRVTERQHVDLIVVGTHGRTGLSKLALGSVAEAVFGMPVVLCLRWGRVLRQTRRPTQKCGTCCAQWICRLSPRTRQPTPRLWRDSTRPG